MAKLLSAEHLVTLAVIAAIIASLVVAARLRPGHWTVVACRILAIVILVNEASWWIWLADHNTWSMSYALPFQRALVSCSTSSRTERSWPRPCCS